MLIYQNGSLFKQRKYLVKESECKEGKWIHQDDEVGSFVRLILGKLNREANNAMTDTTVRKRLEVSKECDIYAN